MFDIDFPYKYCPILSISPSEITALKELPDKDKELILPIFPIKSWSSANELSSTIKKIEDTIGKDRKWIADIDYEDILKRSREKYRPVHYDIENLMNPDNGYKYWCDFIREHPNTIPCLQLKQLTELSTQLSILNSFQRGIVIILKSVDIESNRHIDILPMLKDLDSLFIVLDLEQITAEQIQFKDQIILTIEAIKTILPKALISVSSTSFPDSFGGYYNGTKSIYERLLFDNLKLQINNLIYSDRGSARANKISGGGGTPPPRLDYACRNEWQFIRREFNKTIDTSDQKKELYTSIAKEIMHADYWEPELKLWSNYIIELTSKGDDFGVNSAQKATAVRINKHLHTQLHYDSVNDQIEDTDEDWVD